MFRQGITKGFTGIVSTMILGEIASTSVLPRVSLVQVCTDNISRLKRPTLLLLLQPKLS